MFTRRARPCPHAGALIATTFQIPAGHAGGNGCLALLEAARYSGVPGGVDRPAGQPHEVCPGRD
jgi:hypothetical protein